MAGHSMKEIRTRIKNTGNTEKLTRAMELVASSKLLKAQKELAKTRAYYGVLQKAAVTLVINRPPNMKSVWLRSSEDTRPCYILITGDRGLAGGYNHNVFNLLRKEAENKESVLLPIGKKSLEHCRYHGLKTLTTHYASTESFSVGDCHRLSKLLKNGYEDHQFSEIVLLYTRFNSVLTQMPMSERLLPLRESLAQDSKLKTKGIFLYEPDAASVFDRLVYEYIAGCLWNAVCESRASEYAARRTAMNSASRNAAEMSERLYLLYNHARQTTITQEITEIVAGAQ